MSSTAGPSNYFVAAVDSVKLRRMLFEHGLSQLLILVQARRVSGLCVEPDGTAKVVADRLGLPNGMVLTPDGCTLIVAESMMNRLSAFNVVLAG